MQGTSGVQGILGIPQPIKEPPFTLAERDRRWRVLRELMEERGVDVLVVLNEWLNADSEWRDESLAHLAATAGRYVFRSPETIASLFHRPVRTLQRWDMESVGWPGRNADV